MVVGRFKPTKVGAPEGPGCRRRCGGRRLPPAERRLQSAYRVRRSARLGRNHLLAFLRSVGPSTNPGAETRIANHSSEDCARQNQGPFGLRFVPIKLQPKWLQFYGDEAKETRNPHLAQPETKGPGENRSPVQHGMVVGQFKPTKVGAPSGPGFRRRCGGRRLPPAERRLQSAYRVRRPARLGQLTFLAFLRSVGPSTNPGAETRIANHNSEDCARQNQGPFGLRFVPIKLQPKWLQFYGDKAKETRNPHLA